MNDENRNLLWIDRLYTHFIGEDLAFLLSGGLFTYFAVKYVISGFTLPQQLSLQLIGFIGLSYMLGILFSSMGYIIGTSLTFYKRSDESPDLKCLNNNYGPILFERTNIMFIIQNSVGFSSFSAGSLVILIYLLNGKNYVDI